MSLVVTSLLVAGGVMVGRWIMKSGPRPKAEAPEDDAPPDTKESGVKIDDTKKPPPGDLLEGFVCRLGDVVLRVGGEEAWLAGALVFSEDVPTAALFIAPDAGGDRAVFARAKPSTALVWLGPVAEGEIVAGAEPPTTIEHKTTRFERTRRLPVRVERVGAGAPDVGDRAIVAEYSAAAGERLVVVVAAGQTRAWRGLLLEPGMYDVLPSGKSTLQ